MKWGIFAYDDEGLVPVIHYVRTGIFTDDEGAFYSQMETLREKADYNCFFKVSETDVRARIEPTRALIEKIRKYINNRQKAT